MPSLREPVATLVAAANRHDTAGFLACFPEDGVVDDWGREFRGHNAIREWSDREFIGVDVRLDVQSVTGTPQAVTVLATVGGSGFNGPSHFTFTMDVGLVARMEIRQ
jgi:SnoaL-like domain